MEHIIGNVKGGVKSPIEAVTEIHELYSAYITTMRYPGEPILKTNRKLSLVDIENEKRFTNEKNI